MSATARRIEGLRRIEQEAKDLIRRRQSAVLLAREAGATWTQIGEALGVSRQAAREKHLGLDYVARAWTSIEGPLRHLGRERDARVPYVELVGKLLEDSLLTSGDLADFQSVFEAYERISTGDATPTTREGERVMAISIPLAEKLSEILEYPRATSGHG